MMRTQSLRTKFLVGALGLVMLLGLGVIVLIRTTLTDMLEVQLEKRGLFIARSFAEDAVNPLLTENVFSLQMVAREHKQAENDIEYLFVVNSKGEVPAHTFGETFPAELKEANAMNAGQAYSIRPLHTEKGTVFDIAAPILKGDLGTVHVGISAEPVRQGVAGIIRHIVWILAGVLAFGGVIAIVFTTRITKPLAEFAEAAKTVGSGDLGRRIAVKTKDEIGQLAATFNKMLDDLMRTTVSFAQLERLVDERTTELSQTNERLLSEIHERSLAEEALKDTNARMQALIQAMPDAVFFKDTSGRYIMVNRAFEELLGADREMFIGKTEEDFMPPDLAEGCRKSDQVLMKSGRPLFVEDTMTGRGGDKRYIDSVKAPIYDSHGDLQGLLGVSRDVTERKRAEEALNASNEQFMNLFENSPVSLWLEDFSAVKSYLDEVREKGAHDLRSYFEKHPEEVAACAALLRIINVNKSTLALYKAGSKEELISGLDNTFTKESYDVFREGLITIAEGKSKFEQESVMQTLTGERRDVIIKWSVIPGSKKSSSTMVVSITDLTEHKRAAEIIEQLSHRNEMILKSAGEGICGIDLDGVITFANPAVARMTGWTVDELIGQLQHERMHHTRPDGTPHSREKCNIYAPLRDGVVRRITDEVFWRKDGTNFPVEYVSTPIQEGGRIVGAVVVFNDISERVFIEDALMAITRRAKEEKAKTEAIIAAIGDGISIQDSNYKIIYQNKVAQGFYGKHVGEYCYKAYQNKEQVCERCHLGMAFMDGKVHKLEQKRTTDKGTFYYEITASPLRDASGTIVAGIELIREITERKAAEEALRSNGERLSRAQQIAHVGDWEWDIATNAVHWSDELYRIYGYEPREVSPDYGFVVNAMHPDSKEEFLKAIDAALKGQRPFEMDYLFYRNDGSVANLHTIGKVINGADGNPERMLGIVQDITEQKKTQEALRESEKKFRSIFDQANDGILIANVSTKRFFEANKTMCDMLGYTRGEIMSLGIEDIHPAEGLPRVLSEFEKQMRGEKTVSEGLPVMRKDGSVFYADIGTAAITLGGETYGIGIFRDTTERRRAAEALRRSEAMLQAIIDTEPECVKLLDAEARLIMMNRAGLEMIEVDSFEQVKGQCVGPMVTSEYREPFMEFTRNVFQGRSGTLLFEIVGAKGTRRWLDTHAVPFRNEKDEIVALLAVTRDVTDRKRAEEILQQQRARLDEAQRIAHVGSWERDLNTNAVTWSDELLRIYGLDLRETKPTFAMLLDIMHPDDRDAFIKAGRAAVFEKKPYGIEYRIVRQDGSTRVILARGEVEYDGAGKPLRFQGTAQDITERKRNEEELAFRNAVLATQQQTSLDGILVVDENGAIASYNTRFAEMWGFPPDVVESRSHKKPLQLALTKVADPEQFLCRVNYLYEHREEKSRDEFLLLDGRTFDRYSAPMFGSDGKYFGRVWYFRDITERRKAEEALRKSEANYRDLLEQASDGIAVIDRQGRYLDVNSRMCDMIGYSRGEFLKLTIKDVLASEDVSASPVRLSDLLAGKTVLSERIMRRKDGSTFPMEISAKMIPDGRLCGIHRDISERRKAEVALRKSHEELEVLVHERTAELRMINEQLSMFSSYLQEAREKERTAIAREIHDELGQALTALKIDLSWLKKRLPKNQKSLLEKEASMSELVESTIQTVKKISSELRPGILDHLGLTAAIEWQAEEFQKRTGIQCGVSIVPEEIVPDRDRSTTIFRIFQETLTNITRHAKATKVSVRLEQEDGRLVLEVKDNGKGISEKQLSDSKSLGLMGIRERAASWGGHVNMKGVRNGGTTVIVHIPLERTGGAA